MSILFYVAGTTWPPTPSGIPPLGELDPLSLNWEYWDQGQAYDEDGVPDHDDGAWQIFEYDDDTKRRSTYRAKDWRFANIQDFEITCRFYYDTITGGYQDVGPYMRFGYSNGIGVGSQTAFITIQQSAWWGLEWQCRTDWAAGGATPALARQFGNMKLKYEHLAGTGGKSKVTFWYWDASQWEWNGDTNGLSHDADPITGVEVFPFVEFGNDRGLANSLWQYEFNVTDGNTIAYP